MKTSATMSKGSPEDKAASMEPSGEKCKTERHWLQPVSVKRSGRLPDRLRNDRSAQEGGGEEEIAEHREAIRRAGTTQDFRHAFEKKTGLRVEPAWKAYQARIT